MVIGAFPAAKLGALLLRQISKPIANVVKENAKNSPVFRKYVCMPPAQFYNWCEIKLKMWILNLGKPVNIPVLSEAMAIELGANLLGEAIIFVIAAGVLLSEYNRGARKEAAKEEAKRQEMCEIQDALKELFIKSEENAAQIRELRRTLGDLDTKLGNKKQQSPPLKLSPPPQNSSGNALSTDTTKNLIVQHSDPGLPRTTGNRYLQNQNNLILKAVNDVEHQFWEYPLIERENSLLVLGLMYVNNILRFQQ